MTLVILFSLFFSSLQAKYLSLPPSISSKAIYHIETHQIDEWSCGYNALFNTCNLEQLIGLDNPCSNFGKFKEICTAFIEKKKRKPTDAMFNQEFEDLPYKLKLSRAQYLGLDEIGNVRPDLDESISMQLTSTMSQREIDDYLNKKQQIKENALILSLQREFSNNSDYCIHFFCHVIIDSIGHCFVISLVQKGSTNRALYIFDNLNSPITESSDSKKYINFLCTTFGISSRESFDKYKITVPDKWPTAPASQPTTNTTKKSMVKKSKKKEETKEQRDYLELLIPLKLLLQPYESNKYIPSLSFIKKPRFISLPFRVFL